MRIREYKKWLTANRITKRHLKRVVESVTSKGDHMYQQVFIVHDRIPLFINVLKAKYEKHCVYPRLTDSAFLVDGKLEMGSHFVVDVDKDDRVLEVFGWQE